MKVYLGPYPNWDRENEKYDFPDRKVEIRIDDYDTCAVYHTLSLIIVPILRQLKETRHGSPGILEEDIPKEFRSGDSHEYWDYLLDQMIWSFEQLSDEDHEDQFYDHYGDVVYSKPDEKGMCDLIDSGCSCDRESLREHWAQIQEGLNLFAKYFSDLGD